MCESSNTTDPLGALRLPVEVEQQLRRSITTPGLVLFTGPHGSGKRELVRGCLELGQGPDRVLYTIQSGPPEADLEGVVQIRLSPELGFPRSAALRAAFRADPDVVALDRIPDTDTARALIYAAPRITILACLFATHPVTALERLHDLGVAREPLELLPLTVVAVRRLPQLCSECRVEVAPEDPTWSHAYGRGAGCGECAGLGVAGPVRVASMLRLEPEEMSSLGAWAPMCEALRETVPSVRERALGLAQRGQIALEDALALP